MNHKWYSLNVDETEKILETNAASGLSRKAARSRVIKSGGNDFFYVESRAVLSCIKSVFADPMLLLLIGVDIVAAIFGAVSVAVSAGVLILINILTSFFSYFRAQRIIELMSGYSQPKIRVVRNGELYLADSRCLVPGDIIMVGPGDILPCDARIINANGLEVRVYSGRNSKQKFINVVSDANAFYTAESNFEFYEYKNMLYAGSEVICGEARAIVVAIGDQTYIGALDGGIPLNDCSERPRTLLDMKRFSRIYSFAVLIMILPLTLIGIFTYGADNMLTTFMLTLSLAVSSLGELIYVIGHIVAATAIYDAASGYGKDDQSILKSVQKCDLLAGTDTVILSGHSAITDGKKRVAAVYVNGRSILKEEIISNDVIPCAELFAMLINASNAFPSLNGQNCLELPKTSFLEYAGRLGVDLERIKIAASPLSFSVNDRFSANLNFGGKMITVSASRYESFVDLCAYEDIGGDTVVLGTERRSEIKKAFRKAVSEGCEAYIITLSGSSGEIFKGIIGFKETVSPKIREKILGFKNAGIKTLMFFDNERNEDAYLSFEAGVIEHRREVAFASVCRTNGLKPSDIAEKYGAFLGFSVNEKCEIVEYLRKKGNTVTVFATAAEDQKLFETADICVTSDRAQFRVIHEDFERLQTATVSGDSESPDGAQNLRVFADILVHRANLRGGGAVGIYNAISTARRIQKNLIRTVTYLLCSQLVRFVFIIPAILFGQTLLSPFHLLFGGLIVDLGAVFVLSLDRHERNSMKKPFTPIGLKNPVGLCRKMLSMTAMSAGSEVITALLTVMIGKDDVSGAVFLSVTLSQLILLFILRLADAPRLKENRSLIVFSAFVGIAVLLFSVIPPLAMLTGTLYSLESLVCIAILPLRILVWFIYTRIKRWIKKKRTQKAKKSY